MEITANTIFADMQTEKRQGPWAAVASLVDITAPAHTHMETFTYRPSHFFLPYLLRLLTSSSLTYRPSHFLPYLQTLSPLLPYLQTLSLLPPLLTAPSHLFSLTYSALSPLLPYLQTLSFFLPYLQTLSLLPPLLTDPLTSSSLTYRPSHFFLPYLLRPLTSSSTDSLSLANGTESSWNLDSFFLEVDCMGTRGAQ